MTLDSTESMENTTMLFHLCTASVFMHAITLLNLFSVIKCSYNYELSVAASLTKTQMFT